MGHAIRETLAERLVLDENTVHVPGHVAPLGDVEDHPPLALGQSLQSGLHQLAGKVGDRAVDGRFPGGDGHCRDGWGDRDGRGGAVAHQWLRKLQTGEYRRTSRVTPPRIISRTRPCP